ncbi:unnamed protein product [Rhizoctonia solani]|uniref:Uncharacterized protein n=1 Tax=Rhizoctonia solani TaxID=456999 RepID=A0A8H3BLI1_9AGAM|nr:unnamed protein product [Rhizoctonia solani]
MSSYASGPDPGRVSPYTHRLNANHASLDHPAPLVHVDYVPSSGSNYAFVPSHDHVNAPTLSNQSIDVDPGFSAVLRLQLEGSGLLNSRSSSDGPPVPGTVSFAVALFPKPAYVPPVGPDGTTFAHRFEAAVDEDDIATERILIGAPPARQDSPRSRFFRPVLIFNSSRRSPVPAPSNPGPSQRVFSVPVPTFDIPPAVALPPSPNSSQAHVTYLDHDLSEGIDGILRTLGRWSPSRPSSPSGASPNYSNLSYFDQVACVSPPQVHHPRAIAWGTPSWVYTEPSVTASYNRSAAPSPGSLDFGASIRYGLRNERPFPVTSTPGWAYNEASLSFDYDDSNVQDTNNTDISSSASVTDLLTSHVLQYPPGEPTPVDAVPYVTSQNLVGGSFTSNFARTGALPPHPPGSLWQPGPSSWTHSLPASVLPRGDGPAYLRETKMSPVECSTSLYDLNSTFMSIESSSSYDEIIGNRPEESPFGPAIHLEPYQNTSAPSDTSEPARPVRVLPFVNPHSHPGAQTGAVSPLSTEDDTWVDESRPTTPSPPSRTCRAPPPLVECAYSYPSDSSSMVLVTPDNTLPPFGYPDDPNQVTLPSFAQVVEGLDQGGVPGQVTRSEGSEEVDQGEVLGRVNKSEVVQVPGESEILGYEGGVWQTEYEPEGSEGGYEGDNEEESDDEDEVEEYMSSEADGSVDLEYSQLAQPVQALVLIRSRPGSSPLVLDYSETEGSAHSDDGYVHYSTDSDSAQPPSAY